MFHLMPYRDLAPDFDQRHKSAYIDPAWFDVADPDKVGQYFNWTLDEMVHAARARMHGLCTYAQGFVQRIADARVELIDHAGHRPHLEQPNEVTRLVPDFLDG